MKKVLFAAILFASLNAYSLEKTSTESLNVPINAIQIETSHLLKGIGATNNQIREFIALEGHMDAQIYFSDSELDAIDSKQLNILGEELYTSYQIAEAIEFARMLASK